MSLDEVLSLFVNTLIGGMAVITFIRASRVVTRMRRRRSFANRQFLRRYRADHSPGGRSTVAATPRPPRCVTVRISVPGAVEPAVSAPARTGEERRAA